MDAFDRQGKPISLEEWGELHRNPTYKILQQDDLPGVGMLSTVWLGLDHGWGESAPIIFETMSFPTDAPNAIQERYSTEAEAREGHARLLAELLKGGNAMKWQEAAAREIRTKLGEKRPDEMELTQLVIEWANNALGPGRCSPDDVKESVKMLQDLLTK